MIAWIQEFPGGRTHICARDLAASRFYPEQRGAPEGLVVPVLLLNLLLSSVTLNT